MRWYAWAAVVFFIVVSAVGFMIFFLASLFVDSINDGTWMLNSFLMEGVVGVQRAGDDPLEVYQFYVGVGLVILVLGLAAAAGSAVLGVVTAKKAAPPVPAPQPVRQAAPAGWYPLSDGSGRVAWWNGESWDDNPSATKAAE